MSDPTIAPECTCPWTDSSTWFTYYGAVEPGGAKEYDPECPEHGGFPLLEAPAPCPECDGSGLLATKHFDEYPAEVHQCDFCAGSGVVR